MKYINYITGGVLFALLLAGCSDELEKEPIVPPVSGDEIEFGAASGGFTDVDPTTRTIYDVPAGSNFDNYTLLNIKWQYDIDQIRVYCPEGAEGFKTADYTVKEVQDASSGTSTGYLLKNGATGVRWGDTSKDHNFYAFYSLDRVGDGLKTNTKVTATIPTAQEGGTLLTFNNEGEIDEENGTFNVITPDMTFCLMAGKGTWTFGSDKKVALTFTPIVTVLDVLINGPKDGDVEFMNIVSVSVRSKSGKNIVGTFSYDVATGEYDFSETDNSQTATSIATVQTIIDNNPVELKQGQQLNVKFFLLPRDEKYYIKDDLVVSVFTEGGVVYNKTISGTGSATVAENADGILGAGLITRIKTPKLGGQQSNNWMSQIPGNVLFSQLSLPGSKHSYANTVDASFDPNTGISNFYQALPVAEILSGETATTTQFDEGIRAFDIHLDLDADRTNANPIVYAGGHPINDGNDYYTLNEALTALKNKLYPVDETPTECAVVLLNYVNNTTSSEFTWLSAVVNALNNWDTYNSGILSKLDANSTMSDMRGKIAVIVNWRLGANDYDQNDQTISNIIGSSDINYITGISTSVQNIDIVTAPYSSGANVRIQNLQQCNNPEITSGDPYVYKGKGIGLVPYFITRENKLYGASFDLIETKRKLMIDLNREIAKGGQNLYINDLSGFCVTRNMNSTGYIRYGDVEAEFIWGTLDDYRWNWNPEHIAYDWIDLPNYTNINDLGEPGFRDSENNVYEDMSILGNGGNTCLFAQIFNEKAVNEYSSLVGSLRQPLGIVLMNFAGVGSVTTNSGSYQVQGIRLPGLIMMNNFMFPLKIRTTKTKTSSDTSYSKEGNVWD